MTYPHLAAQIFNTPLLIHPLKLDAILGGLGSRLLGAPLVMKQQLQAAGDDALKPEMFSTRRGERTERGYRIVEGVAVLGINGALVHRTRFEMADSTFFLGYNDIAADLEEAMASPDVHAVLQVYDSPGGEVAGAFEYAQRVHDYRGKKPMWSIADNMAASAAYLGGSASEKHFVTSTSYAGSIGVVMRHVDFSRLLANEGIEVTHLFEGAHKVDGNPYEKLPAAVRADFQAELRKLYGMFTSAVARHRGMQEQAVRDTEARVYLGESAVAVGLADRVTTTDALITELAALRSRSYPVGQSARSTTATDKGATMSGTSPAADGNQSANQPAALTQADVDTAVQAAVTAERTRTTGILGHAEAAGRMALALQCVASGLSVADAGALMAAAPKAAAAAAAQPFAAAMAALGNPKVEGLEGQVAGDEPSAQAVAASWDKAFGVPKK